MKFNSYYANYFRYYFSFTGFDRKVSLQCSK